MAVVTWCFLLLILSFTPTAISWSRCDQFDFGGYVPHTEDTLLKYKTDSTTFAIHGQKGVHGGFIYFAVKHLNSCEFDYLQLRHNEERCYISKETVLRLPSPGDKCDSGVRLFMKPGMKVNFDALAVDGIYELSIGPLNKFLERIMGFLHDPSPQLVVINFYNMVKLIDNQFSFQKASNFLMSSPKESPVTSRRSLKSRESVTKTKEAVPKSLSVELIDKKTYQFKSDGKEVYPQHLMYISAPMQIVKLKSYLYDSEFGKSYELISKQGGGNKLLPTNPREGIWCITTEQDDMYKVVKRTRFHIIHCQMPVAQYQSNWHMFPYFSARSLSQTDSSVLPSRPRSTRSPLSKSKVQLHSSAQWFTPKYGKKAFDELEHILESKCQNDLIGLQTQIRRFDKVKVDYFIVRNPHTYQLDYIQATLTEAGKCSFELKTPRVAVADFEGYCGQIIIIDRTTDRYLARYVINRPSSDTLIAELIKQDFPNWEEMHKMDDKLLHVERKTGGHTRFDMVEMRLPCGIKFKSIWNTHYILYDNKSAAGIVERLGTVPLLTGVETYLDIESQKKSAAAMTITCQTSELCHKRSEDHIVSAVNDGGVYKYYYKKSEIYFEFVNIPPQQSNDPIVHNLFLLIKHTFHCDWLFLKVVHKVKDGYKLEFEKLKLSPVSLRPLDSNHDACAELQVTQFQGKTFDSRKFRIVDILRDLELSPIFGCPYTLPALNRLIKSNKIPNNVYSEPL